MIPEDAEAAKQNAESEQAEENKGSSPKGQSLIITDIFGLGAVAKSPAGKEIGKAISKAIGSVADPAKTLLTGLAKNKVEAHRITTVARAESEVKAITLASDDVLTRVKERIVNTEIRNQLKIEAATAEAIEIADNEFPNDQARAIPEDWMERWIEGVKEAPVDEVRTLWARLLASQSVAGCQIVSAPSLNLLRGLDSDLAQHFLDYFVKYFYLGCYPYHNKIGPGGDLAKIQVLIETGFLNKWSPAYFPFREFKLSFAAQRKFTFQHQVLDLSYRAKELCIALFGERPFAGALAGRALSEDEIAQIYTRLVEQAIDDNPTETVLWFAPPDKQYDIQVAIYPNQPVERPTFSEFIQTFAEYGLSLTSVSFQVLKELHDQGRNMAITTIPRAS